MNRIFGFALLFWIALCSSAAAQGVGLKIFPQAEEMNFPQGYLLYGDDGKLLKTVPGPASATIKAKSSGKSFAPAEVYLSDWSFDRMQNGEKPNWIAPATLSVAAPQPSSINGLTFYPAIREVKFPNGYSVFSDDGQLIKKVQGPTSIALKGECYGKSFASCTAYLSDWSYEQMQQGKKPNWVVQSVLIGVNPAEPDFAGANKLSQIFGPQLLASAQKQPVDSSAADDTKQRGMGVHGATVACLNSIASQTAVYPDAIEATFPLGYIMVDDSGMIVGGFPGPSTLRVRSVANSPAQQSGAATSSNGSFFLSEPDYERLQNGTSPNWVYVPQAAGYYPRIFNKNGEVWTQVDSNLPWEQIDDWNAEGIVEDIIFSHHPLTYRTFSRIGLSRGGKAWDDIFEIDASSEGQELCGSSGDAIPPAIFEAFALLPGKEREWFLSSLPGIYQAVVDAFRRDLQSANSREAIETHAVNAPVLSDSDVYLEFYRSPCVLTGNGWKGGYRRWSELSESERVSAAKGWGDQRPSFYGVRVYREGRCLDDVALFGGVDFEIFTELMLRNYTRRNAGLNLGQSDEWLQGCFKSLYSKIFGKIAQHLHGAKRIYWKASGYFHLLPLDLIAISCGDNDEVANTPIIEAADSRAIGKTCSFPRSLREFGALLVASPDFSEGGQSSIAKNLYDENTQKLVTRAFSNRSFSFEDLPGADDEVSRVAGAVKASGTEKVTVLRKADATEEAILDRFSQVGMAHIATHGFYLDMTLAADERGKQLVNELKTSSNPYFRSGLALAGANRTLAEWSKGNVSGSSTDGVLLASEVKDLDLKNLSLLVLSACSTAEGKPVDGNSVASLREAFLQAGVETLVSTLWDIPDDFAAKLMGDFYQHLFAGETPSIALWHAKKDNFLELRKTTGFAESMVKVAPFVAVTQAAKPD